MSLMRGVAFNQRLVTQFNTRESLEDTMVHGMLPGASCVLNDPSSYITFGIVPGDDTRTAFLEAIASAYFGGRYVVGPHGSLLPVVEAPAVHVLDGRPVIMLEPEEAKQVLEPDVPSHILDHMYARKYKEPGPSPPPKSRKRIRKKVISPIAAKKQDSTTPGSMIPEVAFIADSSNTKVNIIRKNVSSSTLRPSMLRPKILQNPSPKRTQGTNPGESETIGISSATSDETSSSEEPPIPVPSTSSSVFISYQHEPEHASNSNTNSPQARSRVQLPSSLATSEDEESPISVAAIANDEETAQARFQEMCIMLSPDDYTGLTGTDGKTEASLMSMAVPNESDVLSDVAVYSLASIDEMSIFPMVSSELVSRSIAR